MIVVASWRGPYLQEHFRSANTQGQEPTPAPARSPALRRHVINHCPARALIHLLTAVLTYALTRHTHAGTHSAPQSTVCNAKYSSRAYAAWHITLQSTRQVTPRGSFATHVAQHDRLSTIGSARQAQHGRLHFSSISLRSVCISLNMGRSP